MRMFSEGSTVVVTDAVLSAEDGRITYGHFRLEPGMKGTVKRTYYKTSIDSDPRVLVYFPDRSLKMEHGDCSVRLEFLEESQPEGIEELVKLGKPRTSHIYDEDGGGFHDAFIQDDEWIVLSGRYISGARIVGQICGDSIQAIPLSRGHRVRQGHCGQCGDGATMRWMVIGEYLCDLQGASMTVSIALPRIQVRKRKRRPPTSQEKLSILWAGLSIFWIGLELVSMAVWGRDIWNSIALALWTMNLLLHWPIAWNYIKNGYIDE